MLVFGARWFCPNLLLWFVTIGVTSGVISSLVGWRSFHLCVGRSTFCWSRSYILRRTHYRVWIVPAGQGCMTSNGGNGRCPWACFVELCGERCVGFNLDFNV